MENNIIGELRQQDARGRIIADLLSSSATLFNTYYSEFVGERDNYCWPYSVRGNPPKAEWAGYDVVKFPKMSVSSSAMCSWAISNYALDRNSAVLVDVARAVASQIGSVGLDRLRSRTFTGEASVFVSAQVVRLLAQQALWGAPLFQPVFEQVSGVTQGPSERLHPFFLRYSVLAIEQVRTPVLQLAEDITTLGEAANALRGLDLKKWSDRMTALDTATRLLDASERVAGTVRRDFREPAISDRLDECVARGKQQLAKLTTGVLGDVSGALSSWSDLNELGQRCATHLAPLWVRLPTLVRGTTTVGSSLDELTRAAKAAGSLIWYGETLRSRLVQEVVAQIAYASSDDARFDVGALAYSLAAAITTQALETTGQLTRNAVSIVMKHQLRGWWFQVQPVARTEGVGSVHLPLNIEIGNALIEILSRCVDDEQWTSWVEIDQALDWVLGKVNRVGSLQGWCTEHDYETNRIDFYVTAQVIQFLSESRKLRHRLVLKAALERAQLVPALPSVTWDELEPTDLGATWSDQIKIRLAETFVVPVRRGGKARATSVLLYGPPGTSKTSMMGALANALGWDFLVITPADLLVGGSEQVEARATLIFEILRRARETVVLFDEIDEFILEREAEGRPEGIFRFMTTSMLPKFQALKRADALIVGIATNYKERLDRAITRLGRVDQTLAVLPPDLDSRMRIVTKLKQKYGPIVDFKDALEVAANMPCFSYLEMKRVIERRAESNPWSVIEHPTGGPAGYAARGGSDEELEALLDMQITESLAKFANSETKQNIVSQLDDLKKSRKGAKPLFRDETMKVISLKRELLAGRKRGSRRGRSAPKRP